MSKRSKCSTCVKLEADIEKLEKAIRDHVTTEEELYHSINNLESDKNSLLGTLQMVTSRLKYIREINVLK